MTRGELVREISYMAESITENFKLVSGSCLYMSAVLSAMIQDHLSVDAKFVTGSLSVAGFTVFSHQPIKPLLTNKCVFSQWDGHSWIEIDDIVFDLSLFRTVFSSATPPYIQSLFDTRVDRRAAYLIGQKSKLSEIGIQYMALELLSEDDATIFIKNADRMKLINI